MSDFVVQSVQTYLTGPLEGVYSRGQAVERNRMTIKTLLVGAVAGILATVAGAGLAHANCDYSTYKPTESQDQAGYDLAFSYAEARVDADACDTNYGEVVRVRGGFEAYCVPDDVAEGCIEVSSLLDCSLMSAKACDVAMGSMFEACLTLQAAGGAR